MLSRAERASGGGRVGSRQAACPDCPGALFPRGYARATCGCCRASAWSGRGARAVGAARPRTLSLAWSVPRRRNSAEVIGEALLQSPGRDGYRTLARRLGRPPGAARGWLRVARRRAEPLRCSGVRWAYVLEPELGAIQPAGSALGDTVEALSIAPRAWVLRFGRGGACPLGVGGLAHRRSVHGQRPTRHSRSDGLVGFWTFAEVFAFVGARKTRNLQADRSVPF